MDKDEQRSNRFPDYPFMEQAAVSKSREGRTLGIFFALSLDA